MRLDPLKGATIRGYQALESTVRAAAVDYLGDAFGKNSFSGNEKNRLFMNVAGKQFADLTGISGVGHDGDGRSFGLLDIDRDGWTDLVCVNANSPALVLFRNAIGSLASKSGGFVAVNLVGGNTRASASGEWSNRDACGAVVSLRVGTRRLVRHRAAGEGFASQNSPCLLVGIGAADGVQGGEVRWPSGKVTDVPAISAGTRLTIFENPADNPHDRNAGSPAAYHAAPY